VPFGGSPTLFTAGLVGNTVGSAILTTDTLVPNGSLIVILTYEDGTSSLAGNVTDSVNGSTGWTKANSSAANSNSTGWGAIHYIRLAAALPAGTVITYTCGTPARHGWLCGAWVTGVLAAGTPLDLNTTPYSGAITPAVLTSGVPALPNEILFAGFVGNAAASYAVTSAPGWNNLLTANGSTSNPGIFFGYIQETTPAAQTCTVANSGGRAACMFILSFKPTVIFQHAILCSNSQAVSTVRTSSLSKTLASLNQAVTLQRKSTKILALSTSELLLYRIGANRIIPLISQEVVTLTNIKLANIVRSIINSQLVSYVRGIAKTVPSLHSAELLSFAKRSTRNLSMSLGSPELLVTLKKISQTIPLQVSQSLTYLRNIIKKITLKSPEAVTVLHPKLAIKNVSVASNSALVLVRQVSLLKRITDLQTFSQIRTMTRGRTISLTSPELIYQVQAISKTVSLRTSELVTRISTVTVSVVIKSITNSQLLTYTKTAGKNITLSLSELFSSIRRTNRIVLLSTAGSLTVNRIANRTVSLVSSELVTVLKSIAKAVTFRNAINLVSGQTVTLATKKAIGRVVAAFSIHQVIVFRKTVAKMLMFRLPAVLLAKHATQRYNPVPPIQSGSILKVTRSGGRLFPVHSSAVMYLSLMKSLPRSFIVTQSQYLKFFIPDITMKLTQAQNAILKFNVPGKVITVIRQSQSIVVSRIMVSKIMVGTSAVVVALLRSRVLSHTTLAVSSSRLTLRQRTEKIIPFKSFSISSISWNVYKTRVINFLSHSTLNVSRTVRTQFVTFRLSTRQLVSAKKFVGKLFKLSTQAKLVVTRVSNRTFGLYQPEALSLLAGKAWGLAVHLATQSRVAVATTKGLAVVAHLIQRSAIAVYTKVRTLIQKAIILLVGA